MITTGIKMNQQRLFDLANIGAKIKDLRKQKKLSMRQLAARAEIAASFVSKVESGQASPTIMTLQKILEALQISVAEFFNENNDISYSDSIFFKSDAMKILQGTDRHWVFAFPSDPNFKMIMTFEEYYPNIKKREVELHYNDLCVFVIEGEITVEVLGKGVFKANEKDAYYLKAGLRHIVYNQTDQITKLVAVEINHVDSEK